MNDIDKAYQAALEYLYSFIDFSMKKGFHTAPVEFELGRMRNLVASLGDPQNKYPTIHVAGTKGKGSVVAFCASALQAAGYRVGVNTSPHLEDYEERIQVNGVPIPRANLVALVEEIKPHVEAIPYLSTFEITTALAFLYFARREVDVAVIEVGLGGRLDATNVILPKVAVITSVSYDHTYLLGETLAEIAAEKSGIIKPGVPVVCSPQKEEARLVIERIAGECGAPLVQIGRDFLYTPLNHSLDGQSLLVWSSSDQPLVDAMIESSGDLDWEPTRLDISLLGPHQVENAATAYMALYKLRQAGLSISDPAIRQGFSHTYWPARFEILRRDPPVVIDCAHNRDSALKLRQTLDEYFPNWPVILVFGASEDKDVRGMFTELMPRVQQVIAVKSIHPRSMETETIVDIAHQFYRSVRDIPDIVDGLEDALRLAAGEALVLVTGSVFVAAGARLAWRERAAKQE